MMKRFATILLALAMILSLAAPVFAEGGTGTITITNASQGQTYIAYKVFDATYNETTKATAYTVQEGAVKTAAEAVDSPFAVATTADNAGRYAVTLKADATDEAVLTWLKANAGLFEKKGEETLESGNTVTFDVPYGYYYITSSLGATVTVDTNTPNVNVIDKNTTNPTPPAEGVKKVDDASAKIGDTVNFTIKFNATNFVTKDGQTEKITQYVITDTATGLDLNSDIKVTVGGTVISAATAFDANNQLILKWVNDEGNSIYNSPVEVVITYSAVVNADAADGEATNEAKVTYNSETEPINPTDPPVVVKTYQFTLSKVDADGRALTGAEFKLYDAATEGNEIKVVKIEDGVYRVAEADEEGVVIEAGTGIVIKGLDAATYYLEETKAPAGYNMLTARVAVEVKDDNSAAVTVENEAGSELPSTGGMGTTMFYLIGGIMMLAAVVLLVTKKRMSTAE